MGKGKVKSKIIGVVEVEVELGSEYSIIKAMEESCWITSNVEAVEDGKMRLSMAFGQTIRQGKVVAPFKTELKSKLISAEDDGNGADTGDGTEG